MIEEPPFEDDDDAVATPGSPPSKTGALRIGKGNKVQPILENNQSFMQHIEQGSSEADKLKEARFLQQESLGEPPSDSIKNSITKYTINSWG